MSIVVLIFAYALLELGSSCLIWATRPLSLIEAEEALKSRELLEWALLVVDADSVHCVLPIE